MKSVPRDTDSGNEAWNRLATALVRGDQQATIDAVRGICDFDEAPSPVVGAAVRAFALAIESEEHAGFALPMWHMLRALAAEFTEESVTTREEMLRRAFVFYDAVNAAGESELFDATREQRKAELRERERPMNEREWLAADLVMQCEWRANELLEVASALQDEIGASVFLQGEVTDATLKQARDMLPASTRDGGQRTIVLAVRDLANNLGSSVAENREQATTAMVELLLRLGFARTAGDRDEPIPVDQLLTAARAFKGLGGSRYVETMKLCVALGAMDARALEGLDNWRRREAMPAYSTFKGNVSRWLSGKRGAGLSLVKR